MAKKKFFTGPEMEALSGPLTAEQTSLAVASFRIAARVANAAWAYLKAIDERSGLNITQPASIELRAALHDYSPGNWPTPSTYRAYAVQKLEELYAEAELAPTREAVLEVLYNAISKEYDS